MKRIAAVSLTFLVLSTLSLGVVAGTQTRRDRIVEVTVFPDRAEVTREVRVELPRGRVSIEFPDIPPGIERDSLRVTARGVQATLGTIELRESARPPAESPEMTAAAGEVRSIEAALAGLAADDETDAELRAFLAALKATTTTRESQKLGDGAADPAALQATYLFVQSSLEDLGRRRLTRARQRDELGRELLLARARQDVAGPRGPVLVRTATVEVTTAMEGTLTVRLTYVAPGASWRPAYRAALDATTGAVTLDTEASVRQRTGEDWSGVSLRLSTASPARGVRPPVLEPWLLRAVEILPQRLSQGYAAAPPVGVDSVLEMTTAEAGAVNSAPEVSLPKDEDAARPGARILHSSYNLVFEAPDQAVILADDADHMVALRRDLLRGEMEYQVIPMLSESAFLVVNTKAPAAYPLLAGPVRVFAGEAYLGATSLNETGPGADLTLPFGPDNRITVKRTRLPQERRDAGLTGRDRRVVHGYRTTIENLLGRAANVVIEERTPVSEDARIEVEMGKSTTPGGTMLNDRPGVLRWSLRLEPGVRKEFAVDYAVRYPAEMVIAGLQ